MRPPSWYLVFTGDCRAAWWNAFTRHRPGFQHVAAYRFCPVGERWIAVDWHARLLNVETLTEQGVEAIINAACKGDVRVLKVETGLGKKCLIPGFAYCVTAAKQLVGLRSWWVITPWQLFCALKAQGATEPYRRHEQPAEEAKGTGTRS